LDKNGLGKPSLSFFEASFHVMSELMSEPQVVRLPNGLALQMKTSRTLDLLSWIIPGRNPLSPVGRRLILSLMVLATLDFLPT
jgi:hypothetical protein